jgi:sulfur-oxidizing protein SoxY
MNMSGGSNKAILLFQKEFSHRLTLEQIMPLREIAFMNIEGLYKSRRQIISAGCQFSLMAVLGGLLFPRLAMAEWNKAAFESKALNDAYAALGAHGPTDSPEVQLIASEIAENGAVVPVQAISGLNNTTQIAFLVEKNPNALSALFMIGPDMVPDVTLRLKMAETSKVIALVKADGKFYTASKEIKVTVGGCGG